MHNDQVLLSTIQEYSNEGGLERKPLSRFRLLVDSVQMCWILFVAMVFYGHHLELRVSSLPVRLFAFSVHRHAPVCRECYPFLEQ